MTHAFDRPADAGAAAAWAHVPQAWCHWHVPASARAEGATASPGAVRVVAGALLLAILAGGALALLARHGDDGRAAARLTEPAAAGRA